MESELFKWEFKNGVDGETILVWTIFDFEWLLNNQTNRQIYIRDSDYEEDTTEEIRKYQLKVDFCGNDNSSVKICYRVPVEMDVKVVWQTCLTNNNYSPPTTGNYQWVKSNKWKCLITLKKEYIIGKMINHAFPSFILRVSFFERCTLKIPTSEKCLSSTKPYNAVDNANPTCFLVNDLRKLFNNSTFHDVTFLSIDDVKFKAHRAILAVRSDVLDAHFKHNTVENVTNTVKTHLETEVLQQVIEYIYTDNVLGISDFPEKLLMAAEFYQMNGLKKLCEDALIKKLSVDNAVEILVLAHLHRADHLKEKILKFISDSELKDITETEGWEKLKSVEVLKILYKN